MAAQTAPVPARLQVYLARDVPEAIVIRRGPSKVVATVGWRRDTDTFTVGQWLRGRIYEDRCDLSPDGAHFLYFAANYRSQQTGGTWSAISRAPYLHALSIWAKGDTYHGGGVFLDSKTALLHGSHREPLRLDANVEAVTDVRCWGQGGWTKTYQPPEGIRRVENLDAYLTREQRAIYEASIARRNSWNYRAFVHYRGGWRFNTAGEELGPGWGAMRHVSKHWWLEKTRRPLGFQLRHKSDDRTMPLPSETDWADIDVWGRWEGLPKQVRLIWARHGCLYAASITKGGLGEAMLLYDFNPMTFEPLPAPYDDGVPHNYDPLRR